MTDPTPAAAHRSARTCLNVDHRTLELLERLITKDTNEYVALLKLVPDFGYRQLSKGSALRALLALGGELVKSEAEELAVRQRRS